MNIEEPELTPLQLGFVSSNFVKVADLLKEGSYQVRQRNISQYPIFVCCDQHQPVGQTLLEKGDFQLQFNINFSSLEEFRQRGFIDDEALDFFQENYKNPDEFACLFVVLPELVNFVYLPYPEDSLLQ